MPYKDQNLDYLYSIQKDFAAYKGAVVAFNGEVAGVRETAQNMRIILRIDTPLYYYATGKGNNLSYEMIYVRFTKDTATPTAIIQGHKLKVLGRVDGYEKRQDTYTGKTLGVVRLDAIALADRTTGKDFIRQDAPSNALYQSWKAGKLFFEESAESVLRAFPPVPTPEPKPKAVKPVKKAPKKETPKPAVIPPSAGIVFDEEEPPFILPPDPQAPEEPQTPNAAEQTAPAPESQTGNAVLMNNPAEGKETEEKTTPGKTANEQAGKAALNKTTGEQTADNATPGKANKEQTADNATPGKTAIEQTAEQTAPSKANEEQTEENAAPKADKEKAGQPDLNKADKKQTEEPTAPGKATGEQAAEQADLNKADEKQTEEKAANAAAQNATAEGHNPQGSATQAQAAEETPLQAPAMPQTGAQKSAAPQAAAPEKATPAPENTRPQ